MIKSRYSGILLGIITITGLTISAYLTARDTSPIREIKTEVHVVEGDSPLKFVGSGSQGQRTLDTAAVGPNARWSQRERDYEDSKSNPNPNTPTNISKNEAELPQEADQQKNPQVELPKPKKTEFATEKQQDGQLNTKQQQSDPLNDEQLSIEQGKGKAYTKKLPSTTEPKNVPDRLGSNNKTILTAPVADVGSPNRWITGQKDNLGKTKEETVVKTPNQPVRSNISFVQHPTKTALSSKPLHAFSLDSEPSHSDAASEQERAKPPIASKPYLAFSLPSQPTQSEIALHQSPAKSKSPSQPPYDFSLPSEPSYSKIAMEQSSAKSKSPSQPPSEFSLPSEPTYSQIAIEQSAAQSKSPSRPPSEFSLPSEPTYSQIAMEPSFAQSKVPSQPSSEFSLPSEPTYSEIALQQYPAQSEVPSKPQQAFSLSSEPSQSEIVIEQHIARANATSQPPQIFTLEEKKSNPEMPKTPPIRIAAGLDTAKAYHVDHESGQQDPRLRPQIGTRSIKTQTRLSGASDLGKSSIPETMDNETAFVAQHFVRPPSHRTAQEMIASIEPDEKLEEEAPKEVSKDKSDEIAQADIPSPKSPAPLEKLSRVQDTPKTPLDQETFINFNNVAFIQYLNYISKLTGKNFVFDEADLDFKVTIISNRPTTIEFVMSAMLQELRIHNLSLMEVGNTLIIHRNNTTNSPGTIIGENQKIPEGVELITQVFSLGSAVPSSLVLILQPMLSPLAIIETNDATNHLILTDIAPNVIKIAQLIERLDTPFTGYEVGQYVVKNASLDGAIQLVEKLMGPISAQTPITFVPHPPTNSIFIVSNRYLVERAMALLEKVDNQEAQTRILSVESSTPTISNTPLNATPPTTPGGVGPGGKSLPLGSVDFLTNFLNNLSPQQLRDFLNHNNFNDNADLLRSLNNLNINEAQRRKLLEDSLLFLNGLTEDEKKRLMQLGLKRFIEELNAGGPTIPAPAGIQKEQELQKELQENYDYLTPEERHFILQGKDAQEKDQLGEARSHLYNEEDNFFENGSRTLGGFNRQEARHARKGGWQSDLPIGHVESTEFVVHALLYRNGEEIVKALVELATTLSADITGESTDLLSSINSVQYIKSSNSLLITGTRRSIAKVRDIVSQIDVPIRQVLIEMLLLQTTVDDALNYGVDWATRFGGTSSIGGQTFVNTSHTAFTNEINSINGNGGGINPNNYSFLSNSYNLGVIGLNIRRGPFVFSTIGALISNLHTDTTNQIMMNPKIVVEDNASAEIFVGLNTAYATDVVTFGQSGGNNNTQQSIEFRDVGTSLKVTPRIGHNDIITLTIDQEVSSEAQLSSTGGGGGNATGTTSSVVSGTTISGVGPTTTKSTTKTVIHMPNKYFVVLSGMIQTTRQQTNNQIPCLGGIPGIGAAFRNVANVDQISNLMIFIQPTILENQGIHEYTKRQQDIMRIKSLNRDRYDNEIEAGLEYLNLQERAPFMRE